MKTKIFFTACLLVCMAMTQLYAQNTNNGGDTRSFSTKLVANVYIEVIYNGEKLDVLSGELSGVMIQHDRNGVPVSLKFGLRGELTGLMTGEVFKVIECDHSMKGCNLYDWGLGLLVADKMAVVDNLIGDQGSHYIMSCVWDLVDFLNGGSGVTNLRVVVAGKK